jgi:hypothetical protein
MAITKRNGFVLNGESISVALFRDIGERLRESSVDFLSIYIGNYASDPRPIAEPYGDISNIHQGENFSIVTFQTS